ncbi:Universal stress protein family protein [Halogranum amylolyticum]|uniref:Universal stress protein family protein n=1 Tax=Halogranum amylolyticum TaxID=660520 RepID=A0A1H8TIX1_9EURY|nr:universal stress protein [Halogranum amylolyticum]SEO90902.1 Universal stress protein family protein [Halogranum amylolyticum]
MSAPSLLIPIEFPNPDPLPSSFVSGFTSCKVTLLGLYKTPGEMDAEERQRQAVEANYVLYSLAHQFIQHGASAEVELVMDEDVETTPTTVAEERDMDALLIPNPITNLGRVLIAVRDETFADSVEEFVGTLNEDVIHHVTLMNVTDSEQTDEKEALLSSLRDRLVDAGFSKFAIDTNVVVSDDPAFEIGEAAQSHDLVVMGETEESTTQRVFGKTYELVADETDRPVVVLRE